MDKLSIKNLAVEESIVKSVRIKLSVWEKAEKIATQNNISVNKLIATCIEYALNNLEDEDNENQDK